MKATDHHVLQFPVRASEVDEQEQEHHQDCNRQLCEQCRCHNACVAIETASLHWDSQRD